MSRFKKISLILILFLAVFMPLSIFNGNGKNLYAENDYISLEVLKVNFNDTEKKLGQYSSEELYTNLSEIKSSATNLDLHKINSNDVVSIDATTNEAVLVTLMPKEDTNAYIKMLSASLNVNGITIVPNIYKISTTGERYVFVMAFDNKTLEFLGESDIKYTGKYQLAFSYSYTTNNIDTLTDTANFTFYLIDNNEYFGVNKPTLLNISNQNIDQHTYYYNYQSVNSDSKVIADKPVLKYNPYKYNPTINFTYNETNVNVVTKLINENDEYIVKVTSDNNSVISDRTLSINKNSTDDINDDYVELELNTLGKYEINYNLVINDSENSFEVISSNQTTKIENLTQDTLYIYGFETFYKNYPINAPENSYYTQFYNNDYYSDFSYLRGDTTNITDFITKLTETNPDYSKTNSEIIKSKLATTNQAPIKINGYIDALTSGKYVQLNDECTAIISGGQILDFTTSTRFEKTGTYLIFTNYEFNPLNDSSFDTYYQVLIFKIANDTPTLEIKTFDNENELNMPSNNYTNNNIRVKWNHITLNPFSVEPKITFTKDNTILTIDKAQIKHDEINNKDYLDFTENGEYFAKIEYGINYSTNVTKYFTIDKSDINFNIYSVNHDELGNKLTLENNIIKTNSPFSIFALNKNVKNTISVSYECLYFENEENSIIKYGVNNDQLFVYNNWYLSTLYSGLDYTNKTLNNLQNFDNLTNYKFTGNENAVIANAGLYKFTIKDLAQNETSFLILLDNTDPIVLQVNDTLEDNENVKKWLDSNSNNLSIKESGRNLVSNNYSIILGNHKAIKFDISNNNVASFVANNFTNNELNLVDDEENIKYILVEYDKNAENVYNTQVTTKVNYPKDYNATNVYNSNEYNILSITAPSEEIDINFDLSYTISGKFYENTVKFNLNTDQNQILIYGYDDKYYRIQKSTVTNSKYVYIRFKNDSIDNKYKLKNLTLNFYPFVENVGLTNLTFASNPSKTFELLDIATNNTISDDENNGVLSGGLITNLINSTYINGEYITTPGKYEIVKTYEKDPDVHYTQTFYVDRYLPIENYSNNITIGKDINFNFADSILTAENILYFIQNNQIITTNKLPITSSISNGIYKFGIENEKFIIDYEILDNNNKIVDSSYAFSNKGTYTIRIFDNSGYEYNNLENLSPNYINFKINLTDTTPQGHFVINGNEDVLKDFSSTNTNHLSFVFEDSTSDYLHNIDINNIVLTKDNVVIFKTHASTSNTYFNFGEIKVYYTSNYNIKLTRTELNNGKIPNNGKRFSYTLTILDPNFLDERFDENGKALEGIYTLTLTYNAIDGSTILNNNDYSSKTFTMKIDHTSPNSNVNRFIDNDMFLTEDEKQELKISIANKDRTSKINFENYAIVVTDAPEFLDITDTSSIFIRKYDKYLDSSNKNQQSLVIGDSEFNSLTTNRYKFDVNALDSNGYQLYTQKSYSTTTTPINLSTFFMQEGYYEVIEIDEAQNYTIYTVLYLTDYNYSVSYKSKHNTDEVLVTSEAVVNDVNFTLENINTKIPTDYLNFEVSINGNIETVRYFPTLIEDDNITYFNDTNKLMSYINNLIKNDTTQNSLGCVYTIDIVGRNGYEINIINNTPNEKIDLNIVDYSDRFVVTLPDDTSATKVVDFKVYAIVNEQKVMLTKDSNETQLTSVANSTFTFTKNAFIYNEVLNNYDKQEVSIYYLEWKDNFERVQNKVKVIGLVDKKELDLGSSPYINISNLNYTANQDVKLIYQSKLYALNISYSDLSVNSPEAITLPTVDNDNFITQADGIREINLLKLLAYDVNNNTYSKIYFKTNIKFTITLTDLTTLNEQRPNVYILSYAYYPEMPNMDFTDSSSNNLEINPIDPNIENNFTISTSKNVTLSYLNNTLFNISISATRTYLNDLNQPVVEYINNVLNEHTFTKLGDYELIITNDLGNVNIYKFSIKNAGNKTYAVYTNETNMQNFEILASPNSQTYNLGTEIICDTYYSIYNTIVEVNSDFNLVAERIFEDQTLYTNTEFHLISKIDPTNPTNKTPYKYIAITKVDYNTNFLNIGNEDSKLQLIEGDLSENYAVNLKTYYIKATAKKFTITLPLYNENELTGNLINVKMYYNNELIDLNANIYSTNLTDRTQTITLENVPGGIYNFYFEDLAGNNQYFAGNTFLTVYFLTEVIVTINNKTPIDYQIYNNAVNITIEQERLYNTGSLVLNAYLNGEKITKLVRNSNGEYVFTKYGLYTLELNAAVSANLGTTTISKTLHFTILNPNASYKEFSYIGLNGQVISKIMRDGLDVTNELIKFINVGNDMSIPSETFENVYLYDIELASVMKFYYYDEITGEILLNDDGNEVYDSYDGAGKYEIFVRNENTILDTETFAFKVWIRNQDAKILFNSTLKAGGKTTKAITFTFNPHLIYSQIGECEIFVNDKSIIEIKENSLNEVNTYTIDRQQKGTFIVQVKTTDGNTEMSFIVYKQEPLSTTSIIVIILASAILAVGIIVFIKLRTRMKVK